MVDRPQKSTEISWSIDTTRTRTHSYQWYIACGIIAGSMIITSFFLGNILFALLIIIGIFGFFLVAFQTPEATKFVITKRGVRVGNQLYLFDTLKSFGIDLDTAVPHLLFQSERFFMPYLSLPIPLEYIPETVECLRLHLPQQKHKLPMIQVFIEYLGF